MTKSFKTFKFKPGFETYIPLASFLEKKFGVDVGLGRDSITIYTLNEELIEKIDVAIRRWCELDSTLILIV